MPVEIWAKIFNIILYNEGLEGGSLKKKTCGLQRLRNVSTFWKSIIDDLIHVRPPRLDQRWHVSFERKVDSEIKKYEDKVLNLRLTKRRVLNAENIKKQSMYLRHFYNRKRLANHLYHCIYTTKSLCVNCERQFGYPTYVPYGKIHGNTKKMSGRTCFLLRDVFYNLIMKGPSSEDFNPYLPRLQELNDWLNKRRNKRRYNRGLKEMMHRQTCDIFIRAYVKMQYSIAQHFLKLWKSTSKYGFLDKRFHAQCYLKKLNVVLRRKQRCHKW